MPSFLFALSFTILVEVLVGVILGYRDKQSLLSIALVSLFTNPVLNLIFLINDHYNFLTVDVVTILLMELAVVLVEWGLLVFALKSNKWKLLLLSFLMNASSFLVGQVIFS